MMSKVNFTYGKGGKAIQMSRRYAEILRKLGHGTYPDAGYSTRMLTAVAPALSEEPLISKEVAEFAKEHGVELDKVVGTGKDGRIKKSDIEAVIAAQDLA